MKQLTLPAGLTTIGMSAFYRCTGLTQLTFPAGLKTIGDCAFDGCTSLTQLTLPAGLKTIGMVAFWGCTDLTQVTFPNYLESIGDRAFYDCTGLTEITIDTKSQEYFNAITRLFTNKKLKFIGRSVCNIHKELAEKHAFLPPLNRSQKGSGLLDLPSGLLGHIASFLYVSVKILRIINTFNIDRQSVSGFHPGQNSLNEYKQK